MKKLYLITGFLGSGKTTFLTEILNSFAGQKVAVIVNEYGKRGVDSAVLLQNGIESYQIENGSIFCVCRKDLFIEALVGANKLDVQTIIVETSGLTDPSGADLVLENIKEIHGVEFDFRGIVSLIDAKNFPKVLNTAVCVENQVKSADLFVINKCDLAPDITQVKSEILRLNSHAKIIETTYAKIPYAEFARLTHTKKEGIFQKKDITLAKELFEFEGEIDFERFKTWLMKFSCDVYRVKGFVRTNKGNFNVECVMEDVVFSECKNAVSKSFVVVLYNAKTFDEGKMEIDSGELRMEN